MTDLHEVKLSVAERDFVPTSARRALGFGALRANEVLAISAKHESVVSREGGESNLRERVVRLPLDTIKNIMSLYKDMNDGSVTDCHMAGQYIAGYSRNFEQINLGRYEIEDAAAEYQMPGELYSMRDTEGAYHHTVVGTGSVYSLSVLGNGGRLVVARTEHVMRAYKCPKLCKLSLK